MLFVSLALAADPYLDPFDDDQGRWSGGTIAGGVLAVTDATATLDLGDVPFRATARLRLADAAGTVALAAGDAAWTAAYVEDGGITLGDTTLPFPVGHGAWVPDDDWVLGPDGQAWDGANTLHAEAVYDEATATYFLFWTGEMTPGYGYRQIGVATSTDAVTWTEYAGNPVLTIDYDLSAVDGVHVHMPTIARDPGDGTWHMYYSCYQNNVGNRICHATSDDLYAWTPQGVVLDRGASGEFDSGSLRMPDVWVGDDGTWHMLYNGTDPDQHYGPTGYATSADGWSWTKVGIVSEDENFLQGGGVLQTPWGLVQWSNCADVFCEATADPSDPTVWTDGGEVLAKGWSGWNDGYIQAPTPLQIGATWHMWFNGYSYTSGYERIGHARRVPTGGAWIDLELAWDGATLSVTQEGVTTSTPLAAAPSLTLSAVGTAELDAVELYEEDEVDTGGDTGEDTGAAPDDTAEDTAPADTAPADTDTDGDPAASPLADEGCGGCGGSSRALLLLPLAFFGRRRR